MGIWRALGGNLLIINLPICLCKKRYMYSWINFRGRRINEHALHIYLMFPRDLC